MDEKNNFETRVTTIIVVINLLVSTIGGYLLIGKYEAQATKVSIKNSEIESSLKSIELKNAVKKSAISISKQELEVIDQLIPKATLDYSREESSSTINDKHKIVHTLTNHGSLSFRVKEYQILVKVIKSSGEPHLLKAGDDYTVNVITGSNRLVPPKSKVIYDFTVKISDKVRKKFNNQKIIADLVVKYATHNELVSIISNNLIEKGIKIKAAALSAGSYNSKTKLPWIAPNSTVK